MFYPTVRHTFKKPLVHTKWESVLLLGSILVSLLMTSHVQGAEKKQTHSLKFKIYTWFNESKSSDQQIKLDTMYFKKGKKMIPINLRTSELSPEYQTSVTDKFNLYYKIDSEDEKPHYKLAASASIPAHTKSAFIYLFPSEKKSRLFVVNTSLSAFPRGNVLFINNSPRRVSFQVNRKITQIPPRKSSLLKYQLSKKSTLYFVVKDASKPKKKDRTKLTVMTVGGRENQRIIAFFYQLKQGQHRLLLERQVDDQSIKITKPN